MGLSWINPLYLAGLLLLALPVLIHLVQKQHASGARFPSLMFLQRIPRREKRRLEIRNWLLLLLRCLLLLLVVLAFARPFIDSIKGVATLDPGRTDSVIVLDRSYSMRIADHWQQARDGALGLVTAKAADDRIGVVLFDDEVEVLSDLSANTDDLRRLLEGQAPGLKTTQLTVAIEQAARLLEGSNASSRQIFVISDFQAAAARNLPRIATGIELVALPIAKTRAANATITSVSIEPSSSTAHTEFSLAVEVTNHADIELEQTLTLTLDGRDRPRRNLLLAPGAVVTKTFDRLSASDDLLRGVVSLADDALALDNYHYFVYSNRQQLRLLIVEGVAARANQSVYLESALKLSRDPLYRVDYRALPDLKPEDLADRALVILNDVSIPGGRTGQALADFVIAGGGLLVATGDAAQTNWPRGSKSYLPGIPGRRVEATPGTAYHFGELAPGHPLATMLGASNRIDLSLARVFSYRAFETGADDRVVARYNDGAAALLERRVGQGRVLVLTTTLDTHWNDLALQPIFLPFLDHGLRYLSAFESHAQPFTVGGIGDVMRYARALAGADAIVAAANDAALVIESPTAREIRVDRAAPLLNFTEPGFYQVHRATPATVEVTLAANIDPRESSQLALDVDRFVEEIRASAEPPRTNTALTQRQAVATEQRQQLWYTLLLAVLGLTLLEALFANLSSARRTLRTRGAG